MTADHSSYQELAVQRRRGEDYGEGYAEARRAFLIGQAVRERRLALGLSQAELARRAGMTQPALSRLEACGVVPTIPLLERISAALDADLIVQLVPHSVCRGCRFCLKVVRCVSGPRSSIGRRWPGSRRLPRRSLRRSGIWS